MRLQTTTSQTVGPYFKIGLEWLHREKLVGDGVSGERVTIQGRILDADGLPVPDAMLEIWQANAHGKYDHPDDNQDKPLDGGFNGSGRIPVNADGMFRFFTIKPGAVPGPGGREQSPHIVVSIFMRGLLRRLVTRIYFPDDPRNDVDPILQRVPPERRATLIANKSAGSLAWNVVLQGPEETVFFDIGL